MSALVALVVRPSRLYPPPVALAAMRVAMVALLVAHLVMVLMFVLLPSVVPALVVLALVRPLSPPHLLMAVLLVQPLMTAA